MQGDLEERKTAKKAEVFLKMSRIIFQLTYHKKTKKNHSKPFSLSLRLIISLVSHQSILYYIKFVFEKILLQKSQKPETREKVVKMKT